MISFINLFICGVVFEVLLEELCHHIFIYHESSCLLIIPLQTLDLTHEVLGHLDGFLKGALGCRTPCATSPFLPSIRCFTHSNAGAFFLRTAFVPLILGCSIR